MYSYNFLNNSSVDRKSHQNNNDGFEDIIDFLGNGSNFSNATKPNNSMINNPMNNNGANTMNSAMNNNNMFNNFMNNNGNPNLVSPSEGYKRGNLFADLYDPYKSYKPSPLPARNDQEKLFNEMSENAFAAHELNLYLDLHPDDDSMIALFNDYRNRANDLKNQYENIYGPINISSNTLDNTPFLWAVMSWPWEGRE